MKSSYPEIKFSGNANREFENIIRIATHKTPLRSDIFPEWEKRVYRLLEETGQQVPGHKILDVFSANDHSDSVCSEWLWRWLAPLSDQAPTCIPADYWFYNHLGHQVHKAARNTSSQFIKLLPTNNVFFNNFHTPINAHFSALDEVSCVNGRGESETCYVSPVRPRVKIEGRDFIFGYSKHAIKRLVERIHPNWRSYSGHFEAFRLLYDCRHLVGCNIAHNGGIGPCVSVFKRLSCGPSITVFDPYTAFLSGLVADDGTGCFIRLGYCPVFIYREFAIAKTLLTQGYSQTPEAQLYSKRRFPRHFRDEIRAIGTADDAHNGFIHTDSELLGFFHEYGFPQVLLGSAPAFSHITDYDPCRSDCAPGRYFF